MAETNSLLNCRIQQWVPGVRIPPSPRKKEDDAESSFFSGYGAVRLAHLLWEQGVEGSNPFAPTVENQGVTKSRNSFFHAKTENLHAICTHVLKIGCKKTKILLWIFAEK